MQTQIRLFLQEQSDLGLHCLHVILSDTGVQNFRTFTIYFFLIISSITFNSVLIVCFIFTKVNCLLTPMFDRFGQKFVDRVANPKDMVTFGRKKATLTSRDSKEGLY